MSAIENSASYSTGGSKKKKSVRKLANKRFKTPEEIHRLINIHLENEVLNQQYARRTYNSLVYGFVEFDNPESYNKAISSALNTFGIVLQAGAPNTRTEAVDNQTTVFLSNIPFVMTPVRLQYELAQVLLAAHPTFNFNLETTESNSLDKIVDDLVDNYDQKCIHLGQCMVQFENYLLARKAVQILNQCTIGGQKINAGFALDLPLFRRYMDNE